MGSGTPQATGDESEKTGQREATESDAAGSASELAAAGWANRRPVPIEIALADGTVLRGIEHPADGPPLLFVHDIGDDLDAWGPLPAAIASSGFRVIRLELRGHGLSDGDPDPSTTVDDVTGALAEVHGAFGPAGLVAYGSTASKALLMGPDDGAPVHALISPFDASDSGGGLDGSVVAVRVLFTGAHDETAHEHVRANHAKLRGQNMWVSTGTAQRGPALLHGHPHLVEQLVMFMRRYLTAHHLAWIAEHSADEQASDEQSADEQASDEQSADEQASGQQSDS